jgi:hydrogenase maturation protein HypF
MVLINAGKAAKIHVQGVVQGVGFRPFVYRLAHEHHLNGWVRNTSGNVEISVEGTPDSVKRFVTDLETQAPSMARIENIKASPCAPQGYTTFEIHDSLSQAGKYQLVSPDIATCSDCQREIFDASDRRYRYPFTNCTNCGPRFTIIEDIPYDRPKTTMRDFKMCPQCQAEYGDPLNRRFHAQPNACPACGPSLSLVDANGKQIESRDAVKKASRLLKTGKILALRGLGGFQLACDATDRNVVELLRRRKQRLSKPFAVMLATLQDVERHCELSETERELLQSPECPIVLLKWQKRESDITDSVGPGLNYLGVMLPYTPLHHLLLRETGLPMVMTSGNISEEPIAKDNDEALHRLAGIADYFMFHNRDIYARYDDSVCMVEGTPQVIRRARGYAPHPITLPFKSKQILACGPELKNTFCLTKDVHAFVSQHIGDMDNEETLEHFDNTIQLYKKLFRIKPVAIAHDMHPEYLSTKYAIERGERERLPLIPVQHHHAHAVSCMIENGVRNPVIGVSLDGAGYGSDGTIWGGEFLVSGLDSFKRSGHLEYVPMLGGEAAIKKPYRMALSYIWTLLGEDYPLEGLPLGKLPSSEIDILKQQLARGINCPPTSSAGRLFDAASAVAGVCWEADYEAQAAIELEMLAVEEELKTKTYSFSIVEEEGVKVIKLGELLSDVVKDIKAQAPVPAISLRFHHTVSKMVVDMCTAISNDTGIKQVALSGGVFANRLLLRLTAAALERKGFAVLTHRMVPTNDGCISLGQAVIANFAISG